MDRGFRSQAESVYQKNGSKTIYTMIASTVLDTNPNNSTPEGAYHIQAERGTWFYLNSE